LQQALVAANDVSDPADQDAAVLAQLRAAGRLVEAANRELIARAPVRSDDPALHSYLRHVFGRHGQEALHAVFVDRHHGYLTDEVLAEGRAERLSITTRHLLARALNLGARGLILAHFHGSGEAQPSQQDRKTTERITDLGAAVDLHLLDHLILTRSQVYSFQRRGLL
jgi:DNA repair protein RadC